MVSQSTDDLPVFYVRYIKSIDGGKVSATKGDGPYLSAPQAREVAIQGLKDGKSFGVFIVESPLGKFETSLWWARTPPRP